MAKRRRAKIVSASSLTFFRLSYKYFFTVSGSSCLFDFVYRHFVSIPLNIAKQFNACSLVIQISVKQSLQNVFWRLVP